MGVNIEKMQSRALLGLSSDSSQVIYNLADQMTTR